MALPLQVLPHVAQVCGACAVRGACAVLSAILSSPSHPSPRLHMVPVPALPFRTLLLLQPPSCLFSIPRKQDNWD